MQPDYHTAIITVNKFTIATRKWQYYLNLKACDLSHAQYLSTSYLVQGMLDEGYIHYTTRDFTYIMAVPLH